MTNGERIKFNELITAVSNLTEKVDKLTNPMIYNYIDDNMPEWARGAVKWAVENGIIKGLRLSIISDNSKIKYFIYKKATCGKIGIWHETSLRFIVY